MGLGAFPGYISSELAMSPNTEEVECSKCPWAEVWKAHLRLNMAVKGNKKSSYKHTIYQVIVRDFYSCILLIQGNGQLSLRKEETLALPFLSLYSLSLASFLFMLNSQGTCLSWGNIHSYQLSPGQGRQQILTQSFSILQCHLPAEAIVWQSWGEKGLSINSVCKCEQVARPIEHFKLIAWFLKTSACMSL